MFISFLVLGASPSRAALQTPQEFVGGAIGADRELLDWGSISAYMQHIADESDRVHLETLGKSTLGRDFQLMVISDADGLRRRDEHREQVRRLYAVNELTEEGARKIAAGGRAIVALSLGLHSTEVGASQVSLEMVHRLATAEDAVTRAIRESLIVLIVPSMNPDGLDIIVDWYRQTVGTAAEGSRPPWLYHHYAGHDNNRDGFFNNLAETALWSKVLYHDWMPQMILDEHQMGNSGPRLFLPPFDDPLSPSVHPLVYAQLSAAGQQAVSDLTGLGHTGIATSTTFTGEWPGSVRSTGFWHNMLGILSEVASARLATPLYFPPGSLNGTGRGLPEYERRANFLQPWPGGWWRLRNIMDLELDLTWSFLKWAASHSEDLLFNFYQMNRDAVAMGQTTAPFGFAIGMSQHDGGAAYRLVELLRAGGVEVAQRDGAFELQGRTYATGAFIVSAAQPFRPFLLEMLDSPAYPMVSDGDEVIRPYDVTAWRLPDLLGVDVHALKLPLGKVRLAPVDVAPRRPLVVPGGDRLRLPGSDNASYAAINVFLEQGADLRRIVAGPGIGDFVVRGASGVEGTLRQTGAVATDVDGTPDDMVRLSLPRIGLYAPWGGSMDEGWTRLVLDRYGFAHNRLRNEQLKSNKAGDGEKLRRAHDVIVFASIGANTLRQGTQNEGPVKVHDAVWEKKYRGGLGGPETGVRLREFVEAGGTIVGFNQSTSWLVESLGLPARVALEGLDRAQFYAPGTLVRARVDAKHPLAWGMPRETAVYFSHGRGFHPIAWPQRSAVPLRYAQDDVRIAGFLQGADQLQGLPAMLDIPLGKGHVVLFGFNPQRRGQTESTFKLLFNAILRSAMGDAR